MTRKPDQARILDWYHQHGRHLPWRHTRDPYAILLSEIMLQQTQVDRVIPFYLRWISQYPNWSSLSKAGTADVIRLWSGLGYNRRALSLLEIARQIDTHGLPTSEAEWLVLKGIGPYTAAAITVFSTDTPAIPIDTNIRRIGARWLLKVHFPTAAIDGPLKQKLAQQLPEEKLAGDFFQALFDLASLICKPKPSCSSCPLLKVCACAPDFLSRNFTLPDKAPLKIREKIHAGKKSPDRIFRGRILRLVTQNPKGLPVKGLGTLMDESFQEGKDAEWLQAMIRRLTSDGLLENKRGRLFLPAVEHSPSV